VEIGIDEYTESLLKASMPFLLSRHFQKNTIASDSDDTFAV